MVAAVLGGMACRFLVLGAAACAALCLAVGLAPLLRRLPRWQATALAAMACLCASYAQKASGPAGGAPRRIPRAVPPVVVTEDDVTRGYRADGVVTNGPFSFSMPAGAVTCGTWHVRGAHVDVERVGFGSLAFPFRERVLGHAWATAWGELFPCLPDGDGITAVGAPMSAIPGLSRLWTAETTNGSFLVTWQDFAPGRLAAGAAVIGDLVSAQVELMRGGDFVTRSNLVERTFRRVNPDDWDGDGIPNREDPDPMSMQEPSFGPRQELPGGANPDAYCRVDLVSDCGDALVTFVGDAPSDLPDPVFVARMGETNRVTVLIGKSYEVRCALPVRCAGTSSPDVVVDRVDDRTLRVHWPVYVWDGTGDGSRSAVPRTARSGHWFRMDVEPPWLGGAFTWTNACCSVRGDGYGFSVDCGGYCGCPGCAPMGYYGYEGYRVPAVGGSCGCGSGDDDGSDDGGEDDDQIPVGVSVVFSKPVIFLEGEYANTPDELVPWYSDTVSLYGVACGGENGGHVRIGIDGDANLIQLGGVTFPVDRMLASHETLVFTNTYRAVSESSGYKAIVVTAIFDEDDTDWCETSIAKATAVRVEVTPEKTVNGCLNRHKWGACERIICEAVPSGRFVEFTALNGGDVETEITGSASPTLVCPDFATSGLITITVDGESYTPVTTVETPASFRFGIVRQMSSALASGIPGGSGMSIEVHVQPDYVSFMELRMREVPSNDSDILGYFTNTVFHDVWYHDRKRGAGTWHHIGLDNYFFTDEAMMMDALITPCSSGHIYWTIPIDWKRNSGPNGLEHRLATIQQSFDMSASGTLRVSKFGFWVERAIDGSTSRAEGVLP